MKVIFYLKGNLQIIWRPDEKRFNMFLMCKAIRSDGHFLADEIYIQASEIAAIQLDNEDEESDVQVTSRKVERIT